MVESSGLQIEELLSDLSAFLKQIIEQSKINKKYLLANDKQSELEKEIDELLNDVANLQGVNSNN
ncbi:Uncharacterised protein [Mycoplasmopsis bovigenitalium]|uniref:Uncharacterized protein n=1 Tax=Mycoplasmopsis bovigenitalium TaxID=2112 RepID=A0A449A8L0_9BACT|nr:hypothetical protein [Mycoplasmopsis bovigenitalium]VEU60602.1 Uncharacterised protein [Mycoplasmopsis bovigenitalium]VEU60733.1 Uncharacterised protein [Mycoplasmopsis bovigenitalium]